MLERPGNRLRGTTMLDVSILWERKSSSIQLGFVLLLDHAQNRLTNRICKTDWSVFRRALTRLGGFQDES